MRLDRRSTLLGSLALGLAASAGAQTPPPSVPGGRAPLAPDPTETIDLWPDGAPGGPSRLPVETVTERSESSDHNDRIVVGISRPRLAVFRPTRPNGAAVLIIPGGAFQRVVIDKEGYELARYLVERGITAFVLFYRLPGDGWASGAEVMLADAQRAVRVIRRDAPRVGLDPSRLCTIGFSAGGHACVSLMGRFAETVEEAGDAADRISARPDAAAAIYPVVSTANAFSQPTPHLHLRADSPPAFILHSEDDDSVPVANSLALREALRARGVEVEMHLFPDGGHGFGLRLARGKSVEHWPELFLAWGRRRNLWS